MNNFKIGDKIFYTHLKIPGVVTEITSRGFKYKLDEPFNLGARLGFFQEGEVYEEGIKYWKILESKEIKQTQYDFFANIKIQPCGHVGLPSMYLDKNGKGCCTICSNLERGLF